MELKDKYRYIDDFIPLIDSWAITDSFVPSLKIKEKDLKSVLKYIQNYLKSDKEFYIRFAVIMYLDYLLDAVINSNATIYIVHLLE